MSTFIDNDDSPVENPQQLIDWLSKGEKTKSNCLIGSEHEKIIFHNKTNDPIKFFGDVGILSLLTELSKKPDWEPAFEDGNIIALASKATGASISLEPGGQLELSDAPVKTIHDCCCGITKHLQELKPYCQKHDLGMLGIGYNPKNTIDDLEWVPKSRYKILRSYLYNNSGSFAPNMMALSNTVQVNLDYINEEDLIKKARLSFACQALIAALFANSPFSDSKASEYQSYRNYIWLNVDPKWSGIPEIVFSNDFGYEKWIEYLLDKPLVFNRSGINYHPSKEGSFRDKLNKKGNFTGDTNQVTFADWETHLSTVFTDVRIKKFIEMRAIDGQLHSGLCAVPAFWTGLLYDSVALDQAYELIKDWTYQEVVELRSKLPKQGLNIQFKNRLAWEWVKDLTSLSQSGLKNRAYFNNNNQDETIFIDYLNQIIANRQTYAEYWVNCYNSEWNKDISHLYKTANYLQPSNLPLETIKMRK